MTSAMALDSETFDTVQLMTGILQCNGGKSEEVEDFKCVFVAFCVVSSNTQPPRTVYILQQFT